ncbi:hypothetical protein Dimus_014778 [Dionaea muscipula]
MGLVDLGSRIDWEAESYPRYDDYLVLPLFSLFFLSVRFFLDRFIFEKIARRLIFGNRSQLKEIEAYRKRKKLRKFKESAWKCVYFLSAEILALVVTYNEPWFTSTRNFWVGPGDQVWPDQKMKLKLKGLYMYAAGFYSYSIFALVFWETRRSDFGVSMGHHVVSLILIVLSYIFRFARVGSVVFALHDASDVYLEVGKMSKYSGAEALASFSFLMFVLAWLLLRLIYYPFWVLWSTSYEVVQTLDMKKHPVEGPIYYYVFNTLLYFLLVLHIYWWVLMYRMLVKQIQAGGQISEDVRSDSEDLLLLCSCAPLQPQLLLPKKKPEAQNPVFPEDLTHLLPQHQNQDCERLKPRKKEMEDVLTQTPPPSRFFQEDLDIFIPPSPSVPSPFLLFSDPNTNKILYPSILVVAISPASLQIFHQVSKTLVCSLILPEIPFSGNSIAPSFLDKSCNIYSLNDSEKLVFIVSVHCSIPAERSHVVSKLLLGGQIVPDKVLILDSIQSQNFRGKLSRDQTLAYKLETSSPKDSTTDACGSSPPLLKDVDYFPSGSVVDGLAAALLTRCKIKKIKGTLCVSWPVFGHSVILFLKTLLLNDVLHHSNGSFDNFDVDQSLRSSWIKDPLLESELKANYWKVGFFKHRVTGLLTSGLETWWDSLVLGTRRISISCVVPKFVASLCCGGLFTG